MLGDEQNKINLFNKIFFNTNHSVPLFLGIFFIILKTFLH